jgi:uncharacterized membrane protein HdeD (DUF308 family)
MIPMQSAPSVLLPDRPLLRALAKNWWLLLLRGLAAILFGVLALEWPGLTLLTLVVLYGAYVLTDGVVAIIAALMGDTPGGRWWLAIAGVVGIAVGAFTFMLPGMTAFFLLLTMAGWAIATGVLQIIGAIRLRKEIDNEWLLILSGAISVLFGLAIVTNPGGGALAIVWVIGTYAIIAGVLNIGLAFRLKQHA